jgi:DNA-binding CsgD family transcriptional regulator
VDALTASERRVVALAAEGLSNREIAERLFVTQRTVETHLGHAFAKLGVRRRDQLTRLGGSPCASVTWRSARSAEVRAAY